MLDGDWSSDVCSSDLDDYLRDERREVEAVGAYLTEHGPFRKIPDGGNIAED
jgi:predicted N-acyltransferase